MPFRPILGEESYGDGSSDEDEDDVLYIEDNEDDLCIPCPHCGARILEESERCPIARNTSPKEDAPHVRKPWWIYVGVVACLYVVYRWIMW